MQRIRIRKHRKIKIFSICALCLVLLFYGMHAVHRFIEPQLQAVAKQHVGFAINNIVKEVLADIQYDTTDLIKIEKDGSTITDIIYDSYKLNQLLYSTLNTIDASLLAAQDGKQDPTTKDVFYSDGVLYDVSAGYFTHLYFLYDKGPKIPIKMKMLNDVTGELKTTSEPYGINSTLIKITLVVKVNAQVLTYLSSGELNSTCEIPLVLQIVNGKVPDVSPYAIDS